MYTYTQKMSLYELLMEKNYPGWSPHFKKYEKALKNAFSLIDNAEIKYGNYYPEKEDIFRFLELTDLTKLKVVVWGQDPYPTLLSNNKPRAQGYAFGVHKDDKVPQSLRNIHKEIGDNFPTFQAPAHGDLTYLANQGILFMNYSMCYCPKNPKAFLNLWNRFVFVIIEIINQNTENCIHVLWGKQCEKIAEHINSREVLISAHPSPLSARRGFFGNQHFKKINIILKRQEKEQINWNENPELEPTYL